MESRLGLVVFPIILSLTHVSAEQHFSRAPLLLTTHIRIITTIANGIISLIAFPTWSQMSATTKNVTIFLTCTTLCHIEIQITKNKRRLNEKKQCPCFICLKHVKCNLQYMTCNSIRLRKRKTITLLYIFCTILFTFGRAHCVVKGIT